MTSVSNPVNLDYLLPAVPITPVVSRPSLAIPVPTSGRERVLRVLYLGRLAVASAIFVAAIAVWRRADSSATLVATLAFIATLFFTSGSLLYSARRERIDGDGFYYLQTIFDLLLVTMVVHVTQGGAPSQLAPLYILVIAVSALLLPPAGVLLIAMLGDVLYFAVTIVDRMTAFDAPILVQLGIFGAVALGCGYIGARLREAHAGDTGSGEVEELREQT